MTIALVVNMLSGTFDTRVCQTACVQAIYWGALATTLVGVVFSVLALRREKRPSTMFALLALMILVGIFATTMIIGVAVTGF